MKILLLGGTADARYLADALHSAGLAVIYSLAGLVRVPKVDCELVVGGFTQFGGLTNYMKQNNIGAILDVTHPYALNMSTNAVEAAQQIGIPCWRFQRPAWHRHENDLWTEYVSDEELLIKLQGHTCPLLSAGQMSESFLQQVLAIPSVKKVIWRTAVKPKFDLGSLSSAKPLVWLKAIGPFSYQDEYQLLEDYQIDVLVSKNSGGASTYSKLEAARDLSLPVFLHQRPTLPEVEKEFGDIEDCLKTCLREWSKRFSRHLSPSTHPLSKDSQQ
ncbi:precorrin-6A/cobalt-precorrin-6A reductase [Marinomonas sp. C2222]|uniref:Precorrin-6A/cobalt-precorrin-6A reductase n=1 Tax=Marinomonas sargassi TaxID=2984494 RepID=A0ABT2YN71_9GAMM|nr:precorrin-6A/cobalt-precorrin-6A reductase [Marinomonas sargassi]MCV2401331.1 precorrin-6A/cobalt-precorrin-6A reductase [Marinomonas sargassi]